MQKKITYKKFYETIETLSSYIENDNELGNAIRKVVQDSEILSEEKPELKPIQKLSLQGANKILEDVERLIKMKEESKEIISRLRKTSKPSTDKSQTTESPTVKDLKDLGKQVAIREKEINAQAKKDSIKQSQATKKHESSMFKDFEEQFDFLCSSHTLDSLQKIQKDIESGFSIKNRKTSEESKSKAFYDMFQYKLKNSPLHKRKLKGYESIYKYAKFKKWDISSIIETKALTSFDYEIIDKTEGKHEANKNCDENVFYKTLWHNGFIRTTRASKLISGEDKLAKNEKFKTKKLSLNYTANSKEIYELKPNAVKEIFLLSLNSKIEGLIKEETIKSKMIKNISSTYSAINLKRIDRLERLVTQGLKKYGIDFKDLVKRWLSISDVNDKISQYDFFLFLDKVFPEDIRMKGYYIKDEKQNILKVPAPIFKYELFKRVVFLAPQPKQKVINKNKK